jgi:hypothetical protein
MAAKTPKPETGIVLANDYTIAQTDSSLLAEVLQENIGGSLSRFDFDTVKMPAGGGLQWTVPTLTGEDQEDELTGIIVYWKEARAYWEQSFDDSGGGTPPDCSSDDMFKGTGLFGADSPSNPSGRCDSCAMSQWGSSEKSENGQACKQVRVLFMVRPDDMLPMAVVMPPTSIKPIKKYMLRLASKSVPYYGAVTSLGLERVKSNNGITYSKVVPTLVERVDPDMLDGLRNYSNSIRQTLDSVVLDAVVLGDIGGSGGEDE